MRNTGYKRVNRQLKVFSGNANPALAGEICKHLKIPLGKINLTKFSDGELYCQILENVRGKDVFLIQPTCSPVNRNLMELLIMIDAFKRSSATRITAVIPYYGYGRQDRKDKPRVPISSKLVADLLTAAGTDRILSVDLHAGQIQGFFDIPVDNIYSTPILMGDIWKQYYENLMVVSPDVGGVVRARAVAKRLECELAIIDKRRPKPNVAKVMNIIGDVKDRTCLIMDDMVDTANTLCEAANALKENGATRVVAYCTHAVLSGSAVERVNGSALDELVVTDTIPLRDDAKACPRIRQLSVANLMAETIRRISDEDSVSSLFSE